MFGYVTAYKPELKMKDFYKYKAYYCGLCSTLKEQHGIWGQMTLTYDMTFLIMLLTSLYESKTSKEQSRCIIHPVKKHDMLISKISEYAADMNIALSYHHLMDDWKDEKSVAGFAGVSVLKREYKEIYSKYPRQCRVIAKSLKQLHEYEKRQETNLDFVAGCFGRLMAELFVYEKDQWEDELRKIGFFLGKFIYLMDAYEDLKKDIKKGNYNPLISKSKNEQYEMECKNMLTMMMAECTSAFERLPCVQDIDILRNILYQGVWTKFDSLQNENVEKEGINQ